MAELLPIGYWALGGGLLTCIGGRAGAKIRNGEPSAAMPLSFTALSLTPRLFQHRREPEQACAQGVQAKEVGFWHIQCA